MTKYGLISALTFSVAMASAAAAAPGRAAITTTQIAAAISGAGMKISADQVTLLTDVMAATAAPALEVQSMEPWGDHRMKVRLNCAASEECLPFFVAIHFSAETAMQPVVTAPDRSSSALLRTRPDPKSFVVRSGSPATLYIDGGHVHIRLSVVCLENGAPGETIRVASKDHQQTYMAKVVDEAVLRASL